jgi:hypothetical protein
MEKQSKRTILIILTITLLVGIAQSAQASESKVTMQFYYSSNCGDCMTTLEIIEENYIENTSLYKNNLTVLIKDIADNETYRQEYQQYGEVYPFVVISNETTQSDPILEFDITVSNLNNIIEAYLYGNTSQLPPKKDENIIHTPVGDMNISGLSLPILTIILGGLDSFNPCAFFILIFLLNLLLFARSRKRMLLIGGVFIFFSGLLYMIFMFILFETFILTKTHVAIITVLAGGIAVVLGAINIKDFFFFKKGASLSIPDDKKPKIYKQMRSLVKHPQITAVLIGTIVLAGTVNFYELLCTLGLPLVFTKQLASYNLTNIQYYSYIVLYNIIYVIPLIIIVLIFVITLGKRKLTEWHGQIMKLETGIMLFFFGLLFIIDYRLLENIIAPIVLLLSSLGATGIISYLWKRFVITNKQEEQ